MSIDLKTLGQLVGNKVDPRDYSIPIERAMMNASLGNQPLAFREGFQEAAGQKLLDFAETQNFLSKYDSLFGIKDPIANVIEGLKGGNALDYYTSMGRLNKAILDKKGN